jgi:hypothetical protein
MIQSSPISHLTLDEFSTYLYRDFQLESTRQARSYVYYQSENLLNHMQERRQIKEWNNSPLYNELLESDIPAQMKGKMAKLSLWKRDYPLKRDLTQGSVENSSSDEEVTPRHHTKSSLRPRSGQNKWYRGSGPLPENKREMDEESSSDRPTKRRTLSRDVSERPSEADASSDTMESTDRVEIQWRQGSSLSSMLPMVTSQLDIDPLPNSPGDVWRCTSFGCIETIYGASGNLGKSLIHDHIGRHKKDNPGDQIGIVMREMQKCNLPVKYVSIWIIQ